MNKQSLQEKLEKINREYPLVPHTNAGRLFSTVRRMKVEKDMEIPINLRAGFAVSTRTGKHANEMNEKEWEKFYNDLSEQLKRDYPELYTKVFSKKSDDSDEAISRAVDQGMEEFEIPDGICKCNTCGEYKGKVKAKDLNWENYSDKENMEKSEELQTVTCLCDGMLCPGCKKNKIHRPISNSYNPEANSVEHWPWFTGLMRCRECNEVNQKKLEEEKNLQDLKKLEEEKIAAEEATHNARWNKFGSGVSCVFFTVIIKFNAITTKYPGGFESFEDKHGDRLQTDGELISFISMDNEYYDLAAELIESGLQNSKGEHDFCVFDVPLYHVTSIESYFNNIDDSVEFFYRVDGEKQRLWARLKKWRRNKMRHFTLLGDHLTVGMVIEELQEEIQTLQGQGVEIRKITRPTFYRLRDKLKFPPEHKTAGGWRIYTREEADEIKEKILKGYRYTE